MWPSTLDEWQKTAQIAFFTVGIVISILTYLKARRGLLNTVNTEYQKRVMDRLKEISDKLYAEFDADSDEHWTKNSSVAAEIEKINETFLRNKDEVHECGYWPFGVPVMANISRLRTILGPLESDPFVPKVIRDEVVTFLRDRLHVMSSIYYDAFEKYSTKLAKGKQEPIADLDGRNKIHNDVVKKLNEQGCGLSEIESEVHAIRKKIQGYFESFFPK